MHISSIKVVLFFVCCCVKINDAKPGDVSALIEALHNIGYKFEEIVEKTIGRSDLDIEEISEETPIQSIQKKYVKEQFSGKSSIKMNDSTTSFAFDFRSPLKKYYPWSVPINEDPRLPTEANFFNYNENDILSEIHRIDTGKEEAPTYFDIKEQDPHLANKNRLKLMMDKAFTYPRSGSMSVLGDGNSTVKDSVGSYIATNLGRLGLLTGTQSFIPSQFHKWFWSDGNIPTGSNIIGIYPGKHYGTQQDKIIVVGAHWDTVPTTDGFNDNGAGIAAVLESARAMVQSECELMYSIFFVLFDNEEQGSQGSHEFNRGFLNKMFKKNDFPEFQGAIVMDTLINFNDTEGSQDFPEGWQKAAPETYAEIANNKNKGDFLTVLYRKEAEGEFAELMRRHNYDLSNSNVFSKQEVQGRSRFNYREMGLDMPTLPPTVENLTKYADFIRSDHARFWYSVESDYVSSLRSVLLTDSGPYRGNMRDCYHKACDSSRGKYNASYANYDFFAKTVQLVIDTITDMSGAQCSKSKRANSVPRYSSITPTNWNFGSVLNMTKLSHEDEFYGSSIAYTLKDDETGESRRLEELFEENALDSTDDFVVTEAKRKNGYEKHDAADLIEKLEEKEENNFISNTYSEENTADVLSPYKEVASVESALHVVAAPADPQPYVEAAPADPAPYVEAAPADPAPYVEAAPADPKPYVERSPWWHIFRLPLPFEKSGGPSGAPTRAPAGAQGYAGAVQVPRLTPFPVIPGVLGYLANTVNNAGHFVRTFNWIPTFNSHH